MAKFEAIWLAIGAPALTSLTSMPGENVSRTALRTMLGREKDPAIVTVSQALGVLQAVRARAAHLRVKVEAQIDDVVVDPSQAFKPPTTIGSTRSPTVPAPERSQPIPADVRCIGRDDERRRLAMEILSRERCAILILGEPGSGKSTLASAVANDPRLLTKFGTRRHAIGLGGATDVDDLEMALSTALGIGPVDAAARPAAITARLAESPTLILLHDLEAPWETRPAAVDAFVRSLAAVDGVAVLASMRGREASPDGPWCLKMHVGPLRKPHARALFLSVAEQIDAQDPRFPELIKALAGLPLAIVLVAHQAQPYRELEPILREWRRIGIELARLRRSEPTRLTSLDFSLELSWRSERLTDRGRRLFKILGQLPTGAATEHLDNLVGEPSYAAMDELVSTAMAVEHGGRLDLLNPVRDFAVKRHPPDGKDALIWRKFYRRFAAEDAMRLGYQMDAGRLAPEVLNMQASIRADSRDGRLDDALSGADGFHKLAAATGLGSASVLATLAEDCRELGRSLDQARCLRLLGNVALRRSDLAVAGKSYSRARTAFAASGDRLAEAHCLKGLADVDAATGREQEAVVGYQAALRLYVDAELPAEARGAATCHLRLGEIATSLSQHETAARELSLALGTFERGGIRYGIAGSLKARGDLALALGDVDGADEEFGKALVIFDELGSIHGRAQCLEGSACTALLRSRDAQLRQAHASRRAALGAAARGFSDAVAAYRRLGASPGAVRCLVGLSQAMGRSGHLQAARTKLQEALNLATRSGDVARSSTIRSFIVRMQSRTGDEEFPDYII